MYILKVDCFQKLFLKTVFRNKFINIVDVVILMFFSSQSDDFSNGKLPEVEEKDWLWRKNYVVT